MNDPGCSISLSGVGAVGYAVALLVFFVGSLYVWNFLGYDNKDRNKVEVIQRRVVSVFGSCVASGILVFLSCEPAAGAPTLAELLGLQLEGSVQASVTALLLTMLLFAGPLLQLGLDLQSGDKPNWRDRQERWILLRNVLLAPLSEEFVFRSCTLLVLVKGGFSPVAALLLSPLLFALAHVHHFYLDLSKRGMAALPAVFFTISYTSVFGAYAGGLLIRTGSFYSALVAHSFCNFMGFPDVGVFFNKYHFHRHRVHWIGAMYIIGVIGFSWLLFPVTAGYSSWYMA
mmetsp:Transcript_48834/g.110702  ORF Transcript_48834/g.110702 Transcript_48834/m.110702 type:complete len:286 (-) Transcript_48834:47-904(-)